MVLEVDDGVFVETEDISIVRRNPFGDIFGVAGGTEFRISKMSFETAISWMQNRGRMKSAAGY